MSSNSDTRDYKKLFVLKNVVSVLEKLDVIEPGLKWLAMVSIIHHEQLWSEDAVNELKESGRLLETYER